jgi:hypothetical protein
MVEVWIIVKLTDKDKIDESEEDGGEEGEGEAGETVDK